MPIVIVFIHSYGDVMCIDIIVVYFYCYYQTVQATNLQYLETFNNKVLVIESYGGDLMNDLGLAKEELAGAANLTDTEK